MVTEVMKMREEEKNQSSRWKKVLKKRWVYPAVYLACAALLISGIVWFQTANKDIAEQPNVSENPDDLLGHNPDGEAIEVTQTFEDIALPLKNQDDVEVVTEFFDINASAEEQEMALVVNGNKYHPNMGIDYAAKDGSEFEVLAALSGKVTAVRDDSLLGNVIEIDHENGVATIYQSIKDIQVKAGDSVKQGDVIATSGTSQLNKAAKNHLHFEIRKDSTAMNPLNFFGQPLTALHTESSAENNAEEQVGADQSQSEEELETGNETDSDSRTDSESETETDEENKTEDTPPADEQE
ncbi:M23 family metallopeptidase [Bacillus niameyensis]|uniref:M23 family metallopeptidase n=1 Tax=Bacillus niameyensis TaxID=1522308 RepID=UPI0009FF8D30|nr:M23 family metallopeptidase [Bacillus niameyensis]